MVRWVAEHECIPILTCPDTRDLSGYDAVFRSQVLVLERHNLCNSI